MNRYSRIGFEGAEVVIKNEQYYYYYRDMKLEISFGTYRQLIGFEGV